MFEKKGIIFTLECNLLSKRLYKISLIFSKCYSCHQLTDFFAFSWHNEHVLVIIQTDYKAELVKLYARVLSTILFGFPWCFLSVSRFKLIFRDFSARLYQLGSSRWDHVLPPKFETKTAQQPFPTKEVAQSSINDFNNISLKRFKSREKRERDNAAYKA